MEPVEINAGEYYLRQLRADERLDDRPALIEAFADEEHSRYIVNYNVRNLAEAGHYVWQRTVQWRHDERCSWAIAEPTTGALLGEVGLKELDLDGGRAEVALWVHPAARGRGISVVAVSSAVRFGFGALELREVVYRHHPENSASAAVAKRCGFTQIGLSEDANQPGQQLVTWVQT
ncbi:GNAT family N-acetyltransferase [Amycolatopsis pithecellobii]|uniref:GNAT family N-acetyltransferase n=1 Tax=Amycolatopsis pithecellobii TaxID=664692 RepID=A0A6N7ZC53_9PSEU|nr:GNAT family N-acetyltransferase [Amycolatopsis pithecellobii]MTD59371.1 GNAT family N-acetyltransferase [Amycolatopsis pithecellobii]